jgi:hypothetical protein
MSNAFCARCGVGFDASQATMTGDGPICAGCDAVVSLAGEWESIANKALGASIASAGFGLVGLLFNPCFMFTIASATSAIGALIALQNPETRRALGSRLALVIVASVVGLLLCAVQALWLFLIALVATR